MRNSKYVFKRLRSRKGETLAETLVALLIVVMSFTILAGGILASARVNRGSMSLNVVFDKRNADTVDAEDFKVSINHGESGNTDPVPSGDLRAYVTKDQIYFYEYH